METYNGTGNYGPVSTCYSNGHMNNNNVYTTTAPNTMMTGQQPNRDALKRNLTLDLDANNKNSVIKKTRTSNGSLVTPIMNNRLELLQSPDLHMLKLGSPEIERLILQQNITILSNTPTNGGNGQFLFPKSSMEEQEVYLKGFQEAMSRVQQNHMINSEYNNSSSAAESYLGSEDNDWGRSDDQENLNSSADELDTDDNSMTSGSMMSGYSGQQVMHPQHPAYSGTIYGDVVVKQEPGVFNGAGAGVPTMSEMNPIDMASQEKIKLERKRQRNRLAASKCRKRKLERIAKLEDKVKQIKQENQELNSIAEKLRDSVKKLRSEISQHTAMGCSLGNNYNL